MSLLSDSQVKLRLPTELKQKIELEAQDAKRSMNAEIVARLENSFNFKKIESERHQLIQLGLKQIKILQERRTALISAAVTGKIDVRNWQNPNNNNEAKTEFSA